MDDTAGSPTRAGPQAAERTVEFFTAQIRNPHIGRGAGQWVRMHDADTRQG